MHRPRHSDSSGPGPRSKRGPRLFAAFAVTISLTAVLAGFSLVRLSALTALVHDGSASPAELHRAIGMLQLGVIVLLVLSITAGVVLALRSSRAITVPVGELEAAARGLAHGELDVEIRYHATDELGGLAEAFRATSGGLAD